MPCVSQSDITDVNQIFKDLAMLVHEQGEVIGEATVSYAFFSLYNTPTRGATNQWQQLSPFIVL